MKQKVYGIGIYEKGEYVSSINRKHTEVYRCWTGILERCYSPKRQERHPTYIDCTVSEDWLYFQNFAKWYHTNYYEIPLLGRSEIDKDILVKGNKLYSPGTCVFVPHAINLLFVKSNASRGSFPIGVRSHKPTNKFIARCRFGNDKSEYLGLFPTPEEAFEVYREAKEAYIKRVANEYNQKIPTNLYDAMVNYTVAIND